MSRTSFSWRTNTPCPCLHLKYFTPCTVPLCLPERGEEGGGAGEGGEGEGWGGRGRRHIIELKSDTGAKGHIDNRQNFPDT